MSSLQQLTRAALSGDALAARSVLQDWLVTRPHLEALEEPEPVDQTERALAAGLVELLAERLGQSAPSWAAGVGPAPQAIHLLRSARTMRRLREMYEAESPAPLRRRIFFAPANYLEFK